MRSKYMLCVLLIAALLTLSSDAEKLSRKSLEHILSEQGFGVLLQGKVRFAHLGEMKCGSKILDVYYYTWEETNPPGRAIHFSQRLNFLENRTYVGHYVISDRPVLVKPDRLRFPVPEEEGNLLRCDKDGLPKSAYMDGRDIVLEK